MAEIVDFPASQALPTDKTLARLFAAQNVNRWRYVPDWGYWLVWDNEAVWMRDELLAIEWDAQEFCVDCAKRLKAKDALKLMSVRGYTSVLKMAKSDPSLVATVDQWDQDPMALNCNGLMHDFNRVAERPTIASDYCTKATRVRPGGACPRWLEFLDLVTNGDAELIGYLQRVCGYCLTGSTKEQVLFFLYGPGGNGKSTFVNTISGVMGDYAVSTPMDMLAATRNERHPTELARLQGARLVTAAETAEGRRWDETKLKQLTGGDVITARKMQENFFEFTPVLKLMVSGNHRPTLWGIDDAMRRRVKIIPFTVKIPEADRVLGYDDKLKAEWPGILAWMIAGCEHWQEEGLREPDSVRQATEDYFETEDVIGSWIFECTTADSEHFETTKALFESWTTFAKRAGEHVGSERAFSSAIIKRKEFTRKRSNTKRGFYGARLKSVTEQLL